MFYRNENETLFGSISEKKKLNKIQIIHITSGIKYMKFCKLTPKVRRVGGGDS
jgi:hypothetical protein